LEKNSTSEFEIDIDGERSNQAVRYNYLLKCPVINFLKILLDEYDLLSPGSAGLDIYISGNGENNTFSTFINGKIFRRDMALNFAWLGLSHINAINPGGTADIARLNSLDFDEIWLQILQDGGHLPKVSNILNPLYRCTLEN